MWMKSRMSGWYFFFYSIYDKFASYDEFDAEFVLKYPGGWIHSLGNMVKYAAIKIGNGQ